MGDTIKLNSQGPKSSTRAVAKDSVLTCSKTSSTDVYVTGIVSNKEEHQLYAGESMAVPKVSTLTIRIFRTNTGTAPFSADLDLSALLGAAVPESKAALASSPKTAKAKKRG